MQLYEKYRPINFDNVLGQDKAIRMIKTALRSGWGSKAWWISGQSGNGKTTLAKIISYIGADDFFVSEYDSADSLSIPILNDIERAMYLYGGAKGGRVYLVNEAHGLRSQVVRKLLGLLERIPKHVVWIFTTTKAGQANLFEDNIDASPLISRCIYIELTNQGLAKLFAKRAKEIAQIENLDGKPISAYENLVKECRNNMRAVLQAIEAGTMQ